MIPLAIIVTILVLIVAYKFCLWVVSGYELDTERDLKRWTAVILGCVGIWVVCIIIDELGK